MTTEKISNALDITNRCLQNERKKENRAVSLAGLTSLRGDKDCVYIVLENWKYQYMFLYRS